MPLPLWERPTRAFRAAGEGELGETIIINVVVGIIQKQNKILVAKRPEHKPYSGYWEFPGGKIETNETGEEALKRELHEELDIDVLAAEFCFSHTHHYPTKTVLLEIWRVNHFRGEPRNKEQQELRWVAANELSSLQLLEGNIAILDRILTIIPI